MFLFNNVHLHLAFFIYSLQLSDAYYSFSFFFHYVTLLYDNDRMS